MQSYSKKAVSGALTQNQRNNIPKSKFAEPGKRKFPVENASHAILAKAFATQLTNKGKMSPSEHAKIVSRANKVLKKTK